MRIAVASSLQGFPEEIDNTPVNASIISRLLADKLQSLYPSHEVNLLNREDYPGTGDAYIQVVADINKWMADLTIHIHQDAGGGGRGFSVLYCQNPVFASVVHESMEEYLPIPDRGISQRCDAAVLKRALMPTILIECGFYTSPEDEAIGAGMYVDAITNGLVNYISKYMGIELEDEVYAVVDFKRVSDEAGKAVFVAPEGWYDLGTRKGKCYLIIKNESDNLARIQIFTTPFGENPTFNIPNKHDEDSRFVANMENYAPKGGFATTVKSDNADIVPQLVIWG